MNTRNFFWLCFALAFATLTNGCQKETARPEQQCFEANGQKFPQPASNLAGKVAVLEWAINDSTIRTVTTSVRPAVQSSHTTRLWQTPINGRLVGSNSIQVDERLHPMILLLEQRDSTGNRWIALRAFQSGGRFTSPWGADGSANKVSMAETDSTCVFVVNGISPPAVEQYN
jgi:hypothetical protein